MKILQLCKKLPYPTKDGESLAIKHLSLALKDAGADISLLAMNTKRHEVKEAIPDKQTQHYSKIDSC